MTIAGVIFLIVLALIFCSFLYWSIYENAFVLFVLGGVITFFVFLVGMALNEAYHKSDTPKRYEIILPERYIKDDQKFKCIVHIRDLNGGISASLNASTKQEFELFHADNFIIKRGYTTNMFGWERVLGYYWFPKDLEETANSNQK
jgi:energy-coupling factor transporter transmembrane protein EcfT